MVGLKIHDMHLFEIKKPGELTISVTFTNYAPPFLQRQAFRPLKDGGCPLVGG